MTALAVDLTSAQLAAASRLHAGLQQWLTTDRALRELGLRFPEFTAEAVLLKVAAVNELYGTNLYAIMRMAEHIGGVMAHSNAMHSGPVLVEKFACLPKKPHEKTQWHYYSFASKFAHFFIDSERFPIYDSYAVHMVGRHLGRKGQKVDPAHPYLAYVENLRRLAERSGLTWDGRELDRYLWLAGQYRTWRRNHNAQINVELRELFVHPSKDAEADLALLLPEPIAAEAARP